MGFLGPSGSGRGSDGAGVSISSIRGLHRISTPVGEYENILIIANGFGIAIYLLYLKQLIHGYNTRKVRARYIYLGEELLLGAPYSPVRKALRRPPLLGFKIS